MSINGAFLRYSCLALALVLTGCASRTAPPDQQDTDTPAGKTRPSGGNTQTERPEFSATLPPTYTHFQPENCEFHARIAGEPQISEQFRGELLLTSAKIGYTNGVSLRVSCTPFIILDRAAFQAQLEQQIEFAARKAGVREASVFIRERGDQTIASFWGMRGDPKFGRFLRSDTYVGDQSFMEVLVLAPEQLKRHVTSTAMIEVRKR